MCYNLKKKLYSNDFNNTFFSGLHVVRFCVVYFLGTNTIFYIILASMEIYEYYLRLMT